MVLSRTPLSGCVLLVLASLVLASPAQAARDPANRLIEEQREAARQEQLRTPALPPGPRRPALDAAPADVPESGPQFRPLGIDITSHGLLSEGVIHQTLAPFLDLEVGQARLTLLVRKLNARLVEAGWITSRAVVTDVAQAQQRITIELMPGRVESIRTNALSPQAVEQALPLATGDVLSIEALEQGVQQINRLRMFNTKVTILPGSTPSGSVIDMQTTPGRSWHLTAGLDNLGQTSTGRGRARIQAGFENWLGLLDDIQFAYIRSERSEAALGSISIPDGFNTWSASVSASTSTIAISGFDYTTRATNIALGFNRVFRLNREGRDALDLSLIRSRTARNYGGIDLETDRTTVVRAAWNRLMRGPLYQLYVEPAISVGIAALGATRDPSSLERTDTHHQFVKYGLDAGLVIIASPALEYAAQAQAQRSHVSLAGLEQMSLGGLASVRGFREGVLTGDTGYALRQELRFPGAFGHITRAASPYLHLDTGTTWLAGATRTSLSSLGLGMRYDAGGLIGEGVVSIPVRRNPFNDDHSWRFHFQLAYEF